MSQNPTRGGALLARTVLSDQIYNSGENQMPALPSIVHLIHLSSHQLPPLALVGASKTVTKPSSLLTFKSPSPPSSLSPTREAPDQIRHPHWLDETCLVEFARPGSGRKSKVEVDSNIDWYRYHWTHRNSI